MDWISTRERLPEIEGMYLIPCKMEDQAIKMAYFKSGHFYGCDIEGVVYPTESISHWAHVSSISANQENSHIPGNSWDFVDSAFAQIEGRYPPEW